MPKESAGAVTVREPAAELVVLLDDAHRPVGTADKATVHQSRTPLHLAFSCYLFDAEDRLLVTRRALTKRTWPGVWTNSCCGHPGPGEEPEAAVRRRVLEELGLPPEQLRLVLPDFAYRASMDGVEENELCPVFLGRLLADPQPDPAEVAAVERMPWAEYVAWAAQQDGSRPRLSVWSRQQVAALQADGSVAAYLSETS